MALLIASFLAGILTVAAPCVLPLLPVIIGGSVVGGGRNEASWRRPLVITASLVVSVVVFTLLIRGTTALLGIPQEVWSALSGIIVMLLGINFLKPALWDNLSARLNLSGRSSRLVAQGKQRGGIKGDILLGAALGPAFNSCSPTYALILASILPQSFGQGLLLLAAYAVGLAAALLLLIFAGQSAVKRLGWLANPSGWVRRALGVTLIVVGLAVTFGLDRSLQAFILEQGWYDPIANFEQQLGF